MPRLNGMYLTSLGIGTGNVPGFLRSLNLPKLSLKKAFLTVQMAFFIKQALLFCLTFSVKNLNLSNKLPVNQTLEFNYSACLV
ncbi:hypothetical protein [Hymenobacter sp. BT188]|uniref:hypothetical protein n=1 Tax=Hymenobacter sp. BT188 TaxID=2763504 RepID=UPI00165196AB|nr:hypothetical protein [Hymenobacter sp. BT188]